MVKNLRWAWWVLRQWWLEPRWATVRRAWHWRTYYLRMVGKL